MSLTNPKKAVTEQRLNEFYNQIFPYLGGVPEAGFTPVGTVIALMGNTAPTNYLACNGQTVNIADYVELADYFKQQFGSVDYFGGDGETTFGIPDLRGEFLRGTGTNSHVDQGNGGNVGQHQDGTLHFRIGANNSSGNVTLGLDAYPDNTGYYPSLINWDAVSSKYVHTHTYVSSASASANQKGLFTSKPTNTSVLYCIATKNIYLNPSLDYSTNEKVVGHWIDGKPIYQKTFEFTIPSGSPFEGNILNLNISNIKNILSFNGSFCQGNEWNELNSFYTTNCYIYTSVYLSEGNYYLHMRQSGFNNKPGVFTIQYIKTTN